MKSNNTMLPRATTSNASIASPFHDMYIYRVVTTSVKDAQGAWKYVGKIYFKHLQTKGIHTVTASTFELLLEEMRKQMSTLRVS